MTAVPLGAQSRKREISRLPYMRHTNMLVERDETNGVDGLVHFQRPALSAFSLLPEGPNRGISRVDDVFGGAWVVVNGDSAYLVDFGSGADTDIGSIPGSDYVQIAIGRGRVLFASEGIAYSYDGALTTIVMPDSLSVSGVAFINGYFVITISGSDRFYWIAPGEVDPDALSYATAEHKADNLLGPMALGDELWLFGGNCIEVWFPTADADLPFQRANSRVYDKGAMSRDCITQSDNTLFAIGADRVVYRFSPQPVRISTNSVEEQIRISDSTVVAMWSFSHTGHEIVVLSLAGAGTWAYDISTGLWFNFISYGRLDWRAIRGMTSEHQTLCGDAETGQLWVLDDTISVDGEDVFTREITGGVEVLGRPVRCDSFSVRVAAGWEADPGFEPSIQVCYSDDQGATWSDWELMGLGFQGQYAGEPTLRQLGLIEAPGRLFWLRMTDDAIFRINYARMNEAWGS